MKLVTHNGTFHYDEILATAILKKIYKDAEVVRSRDPKVVDGGDIVYDVGGVFDPETNRFDHHQQSFTSTFSARHTVKLSSAGLIYKYFDAKLFQLYNFDQSNDLYETIRLKIYDTFFLYADAMDNGVNIHGDIIPRTLASLVSGFNVYDCTDPRELEERQNAQFLKALEIVAVDLENYLRYIFNDYIVSFNDILQEMVAAHGEIYITNRKAAPQLIFDVDEKLGRNIKFIIYKNRGECRILALPVARGSFTSRVPLLEPWRGLRDEELSRVAGIEQCIFVHATGFTGANRTIEGAIKMCEKTLEDAEDGENKKPKKANNTEEEVI